MICIDYQGFPCEDDENSFIVKELAYVSIKDGRHSIVHHVYGPPYAWGAVSLAEKKQISKSQLGIKWLDGNRSYFKLATDLQFGDGVIWALGEEKCQFLADILDRDVHNIQSIGACSTDCIKKCALKNALLYYSWMRPEFCMNLRKDIDCLWHKNSCTAASIISINDDSCTPSGSRSDSHQHGVWSGSETARRQRSPASSKRPGAEHGACYLPTRVASRAHQTNAGSPSDSPTLSHWATEYLWRQDLRRRRQGCPSLCGYVASQSASSTASSSTDTRAD